MYSPIGPWLQTGMFLGDVVGGIPLRLLDAAWDAWVGPQPAHRKLAHLVRAGVLTVPDSGAGIERVVRLTESGRIAALGGRDPEACWRRAWDGRWRIVLFDVAEKHRSRRIRLQRQLRSARFGYLQDSVWITPDSIAKLEEWMRGGDNDLASLSFLEARPCLGATDAEMVAGAWDFATIHQRYAQHGEILRGAPGSIASARLRREWFQVEWRAWQRALALDPLLPEVLLPAGYRGRKAWEQRRERLGKLLSKG